MPKIAKKTIKEEHLWIGAGFLILVVAIYALGRASAKKKVENSNPDANPNIAPIQVSTQTGNIEWNPSALIKEVHTKFEVNWLDSTRCETYDKLIQLQDVQIVALADGYHKTYNTTLRKTLNDAWFSSCGGSHDQFIQRLDILQIP